MKQYAAFFVLALIVVVQSARAQTYAFKVLVSKGKSEIKSGADWQPLKTGTSLQPSDEIRVSQNAYLGLMPADGQPIEVREAKVYKVSDLTKKVTRGGTALNKYTDFILSKEEEKRGKLGATGAVTRGGIKGLVMLYLPEQDQATLYGDRVVIHWFSEDVKGPYEVIFSNLMGEELGKYTTDQNWVSVAVNEGKFKNESNLMVKVISKNKPGQGSKDYYIKKLKGKDRTAFDEKFKDAKTGTSALDRYVMAGVYEDNLLLIDALSAYHEAATLAPDVELYKAAYEEYVKRLESVLIKQ